ncbi:hypothetical protein XELAEV_18043432mg [Xenopus laevis]|uniref:Cation/H+ exchanger domain-containing protein n=1 Tax=Xenopus laevis TaxID=8355 RepID=A0A974BXE1_XENLA|nr:hypothetical protein XELAEV_18043432mg [Xenopus laevis]
MADVSNWQTFLQALAYFLKMFFGSAALGTLTGLISALISFFFLFWVNGSHRFVPGEQLIMYTACAVSAGIMAILFSGIVMSHYTHHNLSPVTQILIQQNLRTVAFLCETCVFAFLGLSIFSFPHKFEISFVIWCILLVLLGRAVNIFPLSYLLNFFRDHKITPKMMSIVVQWIRFSRAEGLGLIRILLKKAEYRTESEIIVPIITLGNTIESEHLSELTEEEYEAQYIRHHNLKGFMWLDAKYLNPFFTRRLTPEDLHHGRKQMKSLTHKWYEEVPPGAFRVRG